MRPSFFIVCFLFILSLTGCASEQEVNVDYPLYQSEIDDIIDYDDGYEWAEENSIDDFDDCQYEFGTSEAEDGCNDYVKENYSGYQSFYEYDCTEDCSGHEAGYEWAEENGIYDIYDCDGNSQSFVEGCAAYVDENS